MRKRRKSINSISANGYRLPVSVFLLFAFSLSLFTFPAGAQEENRFDFKGFLSIDKRFLVPETDTPIIDFYNDLQIEARAKPGAKVSALASLDVRYYDYPRPAGSIEALAEINTPTPVEFSLWEGYIDITGFLLKDLDLRLGKQRIAWGTADKLNQTDNLNPDDFSDPLDFGRKLPSPAFLATYYLGDWQLIGVWIPSARVALLPTSGLKIESLYAAPPLPGDYALSIDTVKTETPPFTFMNSMAAVKIKGQVLNTDLSASYFHGYEDVPLPTLINITSGIADLPGIAAEVTMNLPEMDVIGLDAAGELFTVGFWAEGAVYFPESIRPGLSAADPLIQEILTQQFPEGAPEMLTDEPYFKYTVGGDYTFTTGTYLNCQLMHGFFTEAGKDSLGNYLIGRVEQKFFRDKFKTNLSGGLATMALLDGERFKDTLSYFVAPEFLYLGIDNLEITLGYFALAGETGTIFGSMTDQDQVYLKGKLSF